VISLFLKLKENLGGFMSMEQMNDVWGLSPEVIGLILTSKFTLPAVHKIDINNASLKRLPSSLILDMLWQKKLSSIEA
jgi:hypothetical protein